MAIAKVVFNGTTKIDTTSVTVTAADLAQGVTALGADGTLITGTGGGSSDDAAKIVTKTISYFSNSEITKIGPHAFRECISLSSVNVPNATEIGEFAFYWAGLQVALFPKVTTIGSQVFNSCPITEASFPLTTSIGSSAFAYCESLSTIYFPEVLTLGNFAFEVCTNLTTASFPKVTEVGLYAFSRCTKLETVSLPAVTSVGSFAFGSCSSLRTIYLSKVSFISNTTFNSCWKLSSARFDSLTKISGSYAFRYCYNLLSLYLLGSSLCTLSNINAFTSTPISTYTTSTGGVYGSVFVRESLYSQYISATNWVTYRSRIASMTDAQIAALDGGT